MIREGYNKDECYFIYLLENQEEGYVLPFKPYDIVIKTYCLLNHIISEMEERNDPENFWEAEDKICCCLKEDRVEEWKTDITAWKNDICEFYNQSKEIEIKLVKLCLVATLIIIFATLIVWQLLKK